MFTPSEEASIRAAASMLSVKADDALDAGKFDHASYLMRLYADLIEIAHVHTAAPLVFRVEVETGPLGSSMYESVNLRGRS